MWRAFEDGAQVAKDFASVLKCFTNVPSGLAQVGKDAFAAVIHRDPAALSKVIDEVTALGNTIKGDIGDSQTALQTLVADLKQFLSDLE